MIAGTAARQPAIPDSRPSPPTPVTNHRKDPTMTVTTTTDQFVTDTLIELGAEAPISPESPIADLGIDSLDIAEFAQLVREQYGVKLEAKDFKELENVGDVIELVKTRQA